MALAVSCRGQVRADDRFPPHDPAQSRRGLFLKQAITRRGLPETVSIDGRPRRPSDYHTEHRTTIVPRQVRYLNNVVEQDHRAVSGSPVPCWGSKPLTPHNAHWRASNSCPGFGSGNGQAGSNKVSRWRNRSTRRRHRHRHGRAPFASSEKLRQIHIYRLTSFPNAVPLRPSGGLRRGKWLLLARRFLAGCHLPPHGLARRENPHPEW
jgi:hypothetical protein